MIDDQKYYLQDVCVNAKLEQENCNSETMKTYLKDSADFCSGNGSSYGGDQTNAYQAICGDEGTELAQITALNSFFDA